MAEITDDNIGNTEFEKAERYNASLEEFEIASASGEMTEEKIQGMDLTPQAKERLINTMKRVQGLQQEQVQIGSGPVFEGIQQEEVFGGIDTNQDIAQVSATAASAQPYVGGSFFDEEPQYDPEYFSDVLNTPVSPKKKHKTDQTGQAVSIVLEAMGEPIDGVVETVSEEEAYAESSPTLNNTLQYVWQDPKEGFFNDITKLEFAKANPIEATRELAGLVADGTLMSPQAKIFAKAVEAMTPDQKKAFQDTSFIAKAWMQKAYLDDVITAGIGKQIDAISWWELILTAVNPLQAGASRSDMTKLRGIIEDGLKIDSSGAALAKTNVADSIYEFLYDKNLTADEAADRFQDFADLLKESDAIQSSRFEFGFSENLNPLWVTEFLDIAQSDLRQRGRGKTMGAFLDTLDAVDAATWADSLYRLSRIGILKLTRPALAAKAQGSWDPSVIEDVNRLISEANGIRGEMPSQQFRFYDVEGAAPRLNQDSLMDALTPVNPNAVGEALQQGIRNGDVETAASRLGVTTEDVAIRVAGDMNPLPAVHPNQLRGQYTNVPTDLAYSKFMEAVSDLKLTDLMTNEEVARAGDVYASIVEKESRGTLFPSGTTLSRATEDGTLEIKAMFGKSDQGGYATAQEAEDAAKFLFGQDYNLVQVAPDQFFVQTSVNVIPDRRYAGMFNEDVFGPVNVFTNSMTTMSAKMQKELFDGYSNLTDKANRIQGLVLDMVKPIQRLAPGKQTSQWTRAVIKGDADEVEYVSKGQLEQALGESVSNSVWEAYTATRNLYNGMAALRQKAVYRSLSAEGYKGIYLPKAGILQDDGGKVYGKPLLERPNINSEAVSQGNLPDGAVWGKNLLDLRTGRLDAPLVPVEGKVIDDVYAGGDVIVRLNRPISTPQGDFHHAVVKLDEIGQLPLNPMNIRKGHVDTNYAAQGKLIDELDGTVAARGSKAKGGNQYVVEMADTRIVNGVPMSYTRVVGITGSQKDAVALQMKIADDIAAREGVSTEDALKRLISMPSRERKGELGMDEGRTLTNTPSHSKHRGQRIEGMGYNGLAEVADLSTSLTKAVNEVRGLVGKDVVEIQRARFAKTYSPYTNGWDGHPSSFEAISWKRDIDSNIRDEARKQYDLITQQDRLINGRQYASVIDALERYGKAEAGFHPKSAYVASAIAKATGMTLDEALRLTTTVYIALRPVYQITANTAQMITMAAQAPLVFTTQTLPKVIASMIHLAYPNKYSAEVMAKVFGATQMDLGMTGTQFQKYIDTMKKSGMFNINVGDDLLSIISHSAKVEAAQYSMLNAKFYGKLFNPLEYVHTTGKIASIPQKLAITFNNLVAYNHAFSQVANKMGVEYALSRRGMNETQALANRLTFTQNRSDQFLYQQQREAQLMFQFMQHPQKMFLNTIADPVARTVTGGKFGFTAKGTNPYADTWTQAATTTFMMTAMVGAGTMGSSVTMSDATKDTISDWAKENLGEEAADIFVQGLIGKTFEDLIGDKTNVAQRLVATDMVQSTLRMMFTNDNGLVIGGPAMNLSKTFREFYRLGKSYFTNDEMTNQDALRMFNSVAVNSIAGYSDAFKAYYAYKFGTYVTKDGVAIADASDRGWIAKALSLSSEKELEWYKVRDSLASSKDSLREIVGFANRTANYHMASLGKRLEDLTPSDIMDSALVGVRQLEVLLHDEPTLLQTAKGQLVDRYSMDTDGIFQQTADQLLKYMGKEDAIRELGRLKTVKPQYAEYIQIAIDTLADKE